MGNATTILVVDDSESMRSGICRMLARCGYRMLEARNGEDALELYRAHQAPIDVLVTDFALPGINGFELVQRIQSTGQTTRILLTSGYDPSVVGLTELGPGVAFLPKPFQLKELVEHVQALLDEKT